MSTISIWFMSNNYQCRRLNLILCGGRDKILVILQGTGFKINDNFSKEIHLQVYSVF